jgi:hypothetical protein
MEAATLPSTYTQLLEKSGMFSDVTVVNEMALARGDVSTLEARRMDAAILLESLDRVDDPQALVQSVARHLVAGGLLFVTALVASGFDMAVLGLKNLYLCPPDRTNCFSLSGLSRLLTDAGFALVEVSTPGVLDVEVVQAHVAHDPTIPLSIFERRLIEAEGHACEQLQAFLQQQGLSSFARVVAWKTT